MVPQFVGGILGALLASWHGKVVHQYMPEEGSEVKQVKAAPGPMQTPFDQL
jgi:hypothetical protein